jgi:glycosyltransferase involved in cell wall biosynthesis
MRVLHVISAAGAGGAELLVKDLLMRFSDKGVIVAVAFLDNAVDVGRDDTFERDYIAQLTNVSIPHYFIGSRARKNVFYGIKAFRAIINEFRPDIIHSHLYYGAIYSALCSPRATKNIYTHHSIKIGAPKFIYKILDFRVDAYIAICSACKLLLTKLTQKDVYKIDNGVDLTRILKRDDARIDNASVFTYLLIGRLTAAKNIKLLIDAVSIIRNESFRVLIAGEGELGDSLKSYIAKLGLQEKFIFLGNVTDINEVLLQADAFLLCSAWEGLPISQIEATVFGLPTIVTNVGGCAEITHSVANGLVVDELDPQSYSDAMLRLLKDPELCAAFKENARKFSGAYSLDRSVTKHLELYCSMFEGRQ